MQTCDHADDVFNIPVNLEMCTFWVCTNAVTCAFFDNQHTAVRRLQDHPIDFSLGSLGHWHTRQFQSRFSTIPASSSVHINKFQSRSDRLVPQDNSKVDFRQFQRRAASQKNPKKIDWFHKTIPKSIFDNSSLQQRPKKIQSRSIGSTRPFQSRFSTIPACSKIP